MPKGLHSKADGQFCPACASVERSWRRLERRNKVAAIQEGEGEGEGEAILDFDVAQSGVVDDCVIQVGGKIK